MNLNGAAAAAAAAPHEAGENGHHHDTHAMPPEFIQKAHWHYTQVKRAELDEDENAVDFGRGLTSIQEDTVRPVGTLKGSTVADACNAYKSAYLGTTEPIGDVEDVVVYEHKEFPGLRILPGLLPPEIQMMFTSQILHRDLANWNHKNNLMPDYNVPFRQHPESREEDENHSSISYFKSFFTYPQNGQSGPVLVPKTPAAMKPLNMAQFLTTKLRWLTIGDQYDWPTRSYTRGGPSAFPTDLASLVTGLFPDIRPESGVVLLYSSKDFMPVHRDVSEQCQTPLASFSLGCDGIFIVARGEDGGEGEERPRTVAIRVRSGDCIHLSGEARWAWHAMARTISGTCPEFLAQWPKGTPGATVEERKTYERWKGFMGGKRLNISCRQVWN